MGILTQGILKLDLGGNVPRQPSSTRKLSEHIFFFVVVQLQTYKVKSLITDKAGIVRFLVTHAFIKSFFFTITELFLTC